MIRRLLPGLLTASALFAQTNVPVVTVPDARLYTTSTLTSCLMTDASNKCAPLIFRLPVSQNITAVGFRTGTVTTSQSLDIRLENVSVTTGVPDGTLYRSSTAGTQATVVSNTSYEVNLGTAPTGSAAGDILAVVIQWTSFSGTPSLNINAGTAQGARFPYTATCTGAACSWVLSSGTPAAYVKYGSTVIYVDNTIPYFTTAANANINSTPDEVGLRFNLPYSARVVGFTGGLGLAAGADYNVVLYSDDNSVLATTSSDGDLRGATGGGVVSVLFAAPYTVAASTWYRIVVKPTTVNNVTFYRHDYPSQAVADAWAKGANIYYTSRADAGVWTDDATRAGSFGVVLDQITLTGGGAAMPTVISQ